MEISEKEYSELRAQVQALQNQVSQMNTPKRTSLLDMLNERVISHVNIVDNKYPIFTYEYMNSDAWTLMLGLAKIIHKPSWLFIQRRSHYGNRCHSFIDPVDVGSCPKKISELTIEQQEISAQMLNEVIPIYNKYFKMLHRQVLYDPTGKGDYEPARVVDKGALMKADNA